MSFVAQHHHHDDETPIVPRWVLFAAATAIGVSIFMAATSRSGHVAMPPSTPTIQRSLQFTDMPDGTVLVIDTGTHLKVASLARNSNAFIRGTLRGLAHAVGTDGKNRPFLVTAWQDGRVTLADPVTNRVLDLEAFGSANVGAFANLLTAEERAP
jgi:putative photosynthetic complex assembly protein